MPKALTRKISRKKKELISTKILKIPRKIRLIKYEQEIFFFLITFSLVLVLNALTVRGNQNSTWKRNIRTEKGIEAISNPMLPLYGEILLDLHKEWAIGENDEEGNLLYGSVEIDFDTNDNIYILDKGNCRIQKYDHIGKYIKTIEKRRGQAPGELNNPIGIRLDAKGNIYIIEYNRINIFDNEGNFLNTRPIKEMLFDYWLARENKIFGKIVSFTTKGRMSEIISIDMNGKRDLTVASFLYPIGSIYKGAVIGTYNSYSPNLIMEGINENIGIFGQSSEYKLCVFNLEGKITKIIRKDDVPEFITKKEKAAQIEKEISMWKKKGIYLTEKEVEKLYSFQKHKPFFMDIKSDNRGNILVERYPIKNEKAIFDLFDNNGYYVFRLKIMPPMYIKTFRNGILYAAKNNELGYIIIEKYTISNWHFIEDRLKSIKSSGQSK